MPLERVLLSANAEAGGRGGGHQVSFPATLTAYAFETGSSTAPGAKLEVRGQMLSDPLVSASPQHWVHWTMKLQSSFYVEGWDLNSDPHVCSYPQKHHPSPKHEVDLEI